MGWELYVCHGLNMTWTQAFWQLRLLNRMLHKSSRRRTLKSLGPAKNKLQGKHILPPICSSKKERKKKTIAYIIYITIVICSAIWFKLSDWRATQPNVTKKSHSEHQTNFLTSTRVSGYKTFLFRCVNIKWWRSPFTMLTVGALLQQWQWHALVNRSHSLFLLIPTIPSYLRWHKGSFVTWFLH